MQNLALLGMTIADDVAYKRKGRPFAAALLKTTSKAKLGDGNFGAKVDVLDGVEELDTFLHGPLKCFAAGDEAGAAGAFIDDGGGYGFFEVVGTGGAAGV